MDAALAFGKVLRRMRVAKGLSQEKLGLEADLRRTYISVLELGQQQPSLSTIFKLANAFEYRASYIIEMVEVELELYK